MPGLDQSPQHGRAADVFLALGQPSETSQEDMSRFREYLLRLLNDKDEKRYAKTLALDQQKATTLVNLLHWILKSMVVPSDPLYKRRLEIRRLMFRISKDANIYPEYLYIEDIEWDTGEQFSGGAASDVYVMRWKGEAVCVKRLRVFGMVDIQALQRSLCREAMICQQLDHPRILKLLGVIAKPEVNKLCIVTPWIRAGNLNDFQFERRPQNVNPIRLLIQVAEGLAWMHEEGVVHGDIKAANILVDDEGNIKITDFGVTLVIDTTGGHTGPTEGTERYAAPELLDPSSFGLPECRPTRQSDVYSLAHTMVEAYTLTRPFPEERTSVMVMRRVLQGQRPPQPAPAQCYGRKIPDALWGLISRSWSQAIEERPEMSYIHSQLCGMVNM